MWTRNTFEKFAFWGSLYSLGLTFTPSKSQAHNRHKNDDDDTEEAKDEYERGDDNERYDLEVRL